jgi:hypothetical protein
VRVDRIPHTGAKQPVQLGGRLAGFEQCIFGDMLAEAATLSVPRVYQIRARR